MMIPSWLVLPVLVLNFGVTLYLKPWALIANRIGMWRGERRIQAFRVTGILLVSKTERT